VSASRIEMKNPLQPPASVGDSGWVAWVAAWRHAPPRPSDAAPSMQYGGTVRRYSTKVQYEVAWPRFEVIAGRFSLALVEFGRDP
jgi:hypothetical protein